MTNSIQCENIVKKYKDFLLKSVSLTIKPGYLTGLIGVNGSGKTTLINIIAGLDTDFEGKVNINGIDIKKNTSEAKQEIGLISEKLSFFMDKTAYENGVLLGEYFNNWSMEDYYIWLDKMNIPKGQPLYQFSKGMKMKFQVSFAMAHSPKFLLLDEPTAGFDPVFRKDFLSMLQDILNQDIGILMSTHITSDLDKIADYIILLDNGEIKINDTKEALEDNFKRKQLEDSLNKKFHISDLL
ncbi:MULTISPECIES: ABC transporter ATP-binding protein [Clostridium]|uniref:ABC transporter ATP-binding protein n=1 Tax=Clostridium TaxID=1485 RepID=UPI0018ABC0EF|nr:MULTISPECIES: ABC transporter ATP-binding protein [Clostridium]MDB1931804.1 ABC transporter ATP-binding protein [Clostridium tertium]MDB1935428.1 ABC transporter ATP-binding protein [Clostridium tertium]MDB1968824.1 ABC transporter ATP-binding protein [Clostridium tertium]MDU1277620.1 ABC transporter ATP-binding protein [Clostridium sp.]MDU1568500.1 ABC transporter ATP-binding protein [Clostridium sp.]